MRLQFDIRFWKRVILQPTADETKFEALIVAMVCSSILIFIFSKCVVPSARRRRQNNLWPQKSLRYVVPVWIPFCEIMLFIQPDACRKILNRISSPSSGLHRNALHFLNQYSGPQLNFSLANNRPSAGLLLCRMTQISKSLLRPSAEICYSDETSPLTPRNYTPAVRKFILTYFQQKIHHKIRVGL